MAEPKTQKTDASVEAFLESLPKEETRADCFEIVKLMKQATKAEPAMWGSSIVGFGEQMQTYANGSQLLWPVIAFSPRKQYITLYVTPTSRTTKTSSKSWGNTPPPRFVCISRNWQMWTSKCLKRSSLPR